MEDNPWMDDVSWAPSCLPACQCLVEAEDMSRLWEGMQPPACGSRLGGWGVEGEEEKEEGRR